jgi:hypothetical protein
MLVVVFFILGKSPASEAYVPTFRNTQFNEDGTQCSETSTHKTQKPRITQNKEYNIQNMATLSIKEYAPCYYSAFYICTSVNVTRALLIIYDLNKISPMCVTHSVHLTPST